MSRRDKAEQNFLSGYNCAQSLVLAFADMVPVDKDTLVKLASPFGGGMGRMRETCGAVSGMLIILGLLYGYPDADTGEKKSELYRKVQELCFSFEREKGSLICRDLLGLSEKHSEPIPSARTETYYKKRPCQNLIGFAAGLLEQFIKDNPITGE